jgi:hypothetical protein
MWPLTYLPASPEVSWQLAALFVASVVFVFTVFALLLGRMRKRREIRRITCPVNHRRSLVIVQRSADRTGDLAVHCSQWHDGKLDCGQRCLTRAA